MVRYLFSFLTLVSLATYPVAANAATDAQETTHPSLVVRIRSLDEMMTSVRFLAKESGHDDQAKQIDAFLKEQIGGKGFNGIDTKRPLGLYGIIGPNGIDSTGVAMIPVSDEKAFLELLEKLNQKAEKGDDGIYTLNLENVPVPIHFRFANKYAYVTVQDKGGIAKEKLLVADKVISGKQKGLVSVVFRIDHIPDAIRQIALQQFEVQIANAKEEKQPNETPAQTKVRELTMDKTAQGIISLIQEGKELGMFFDVDREKQNFSVEMSFTGKKGTKLSEGIANLKKVKSMFASLLQKNDAMNLLVHVALPQDLRKAIEPVFDDGIKQGLNSEKDPKKREQAEKFLKVLGPTLKSGELDTAFVIQGPKEGKHYSFVLGLKIKEGKKIESALKELVSELPEKDRAKIKLDAETEGELKIHRVDIQDDTDAKVQKLFGKSPLYFTLQDEALHVSVGPDAVSLLKNAATFEAKPASLVHYHVSFQKLASMLGDQSENVYGESGRAAAEKAFGKSSGKDDFSFHVEGGNALRIALEMKTPVLRFFDELGKARAQAGEVTPKKTIKKKATKETQPNEEKNDK